jgi:hypothetical protein
MMRHEGRPMEPELQNIAVWQASIEPRPRC